MNDITFIFIVVTMFIALGMIAAAIWWFIRQIRAGGVTWGATKKLAGRVWEAVTGIGGGYG